MEPLGWKKHQLATQVSASGVTMSNPSEILMFCFYTKKMSIVSTSIVWNLQQKPDTFRLQKTKVWFDSLPLDAFHHRLVSSGIRRTQHCSCHSCSTPTRDLISQGLFSVQKQDGDPRRYIPIASMYGKCTYIYHKNQPNVGKMPYMYAMWI